MEGHAGSVVGGRMTAKIDSFRDFASVMCVIFLLRIAALQNRQSPATCRCQNCGINLKHGERKPNEIKQLYKSEMVTPRNPHD